MGWKASTIIIHKPSQVENEQLLKDLGFEGLSKIEDEPFEVAMNPEDNKVFIGSYKDNLLICTQEIPMLFYEKVESQIEVILKNKFPQSEICTIALHSVVNFWGYSVIKNGQKIRARAGSADDGTFLEFGEPLEEEKELISKSKLDEDGNRIYLIDEDSFYEDQVGENFVFSICKRYFGVELDFADELLFETNLTGYKFKRISTNDKQAWWKFW